MKNIMKKLLVLLFVSSLSLSNYYNIPTLAEDSEFLISNPIELIEVTETFKNLIDELYQNSTVFVLNHDGSDMTSIFKTKNFINYQRRDYQMIFNNFKCYADSLTKDIELNTVQTRGFTSATYSKYFYTLISNKWNNRDSAELGYYVYIPTTYDDNTYNVTSLYNPYFTTQYYTWWSVSYESLQATKNKSGSWDYYSSISFVPWGTFAEYEDYLTEYNRVQVPGTLSFQPCYVN